jgi:citrate synthase
MAALAVNNGTYQGAREIFIAANYWQECGKNLQQWQEYLRTPPAEEQIDVWVPIEHAPGFDPHGVSCTTPVKQVLHYLSEIFPGGALTWLQEHRHTLETAANAPRAITGVAAAAFIDLGCNAEQAEMLYLLLRLPGAAAHALEQRAYGLLKFPFFADG